MQAFLGPIDKDRVLTEGSLTVASSHTITIKRAPPGPPRSPCSSVCPGPYARSTNFLKVGRANLGLWSCKSTAVTVPSAQGPFYQPGRVPWLSVVFRCFPGLQGWDWNLGADEQRLTPRDQETHSYLDMRQKGDSDGEPSENELRPQLGIPFESFLSLQFAGERLGHRTDLHSGYSGRQSLCSPFPEALLRGPQ